MKENFEIKMVDESTAKKILGIQGWFLRGEKRERVLISKLVSMEIKKRKNSGERISAEEIDKIKFSYDPIFKKKVIDKVHSDADNDYRRRVGNAQHRVKRLESSRMREIKRIEEARWENLIPKKIRYNMTEGVLIINNSRARFSDIKGAAVNIKESYRTITKEEGKSRKHASVGGALVGGLCFGAVGAIVGGAALGKTTHQGTVDTNNIPTATHIGVVIDINGFINEIPLLDKTIDQDSKEFISTVRKAQDIISKLQYLAGTPVPENFLKAEEEESVLLIDAQIVRAKDLVEFEKANVPRYDIPSRYL